MAGAAQELVRWLDELGRVSDEKGKLVRTFLSPAMRRANERVGKWMRGAGLAVREDAVGNVIGRLESARADAKTLVLGSHLDTVRDAGKFDGALGVLLAIAAVKELRARRVTLPFAIEIVGFAEEEGVRFSSAYLGSKGYIGKLTAADWQLRDPTGISVREAVSGRNTDSRNRFQAPSKSNLIGYFEVHIEQGPVLEKERLAVGIVSAIAGQTRGRMTFRGQAAHAGTTPMNLRHDALAGAAEFIRFLESTARLRAPLVATVGMIAVSPGAANVIPGEAALSLDVRHPRDEARRAALRHLLEEAKAIARRRGLKAWWERTQNNGAVECSPKLTRLLGDCVERVQGKSIELVSGAGHDAVVMAEVTDIAMLFVRCRDGLSHHPDEFASPKDLAVALNVTTDFIERLAGKVGRASARSRGSERQEKAG